MRIDHLAADALMALGMKPYTANDLASRVGDVLGLSPLGVVGSVLNLIDAKRRDDLPGALVVAAGMIPSAKSFTRGVPKVTLAVLDAHLKGTAEAQKMQRSAVPGSRKAKDGHYYVLDSKHPRKFLMVVHHA